MNREELEDAVEWFEKDIKYLDKLIYKYEFLTDEWSILMCNAIKEARDHSKRLAFDLSIELNK
jgi:hypothetical protein